MITSTVAFYLSVVSSTGTKNSKKIELIFKTAEGLQAFLPIIQIFCFTAQTNFM